MNIVRKAALILAAMTALAAAAFNLDLPVETINGKSYYVYRVAPKETVYSITRKLGITRDELIAANPSVADGLRAGETLLFPADGASKNSIIGNVEAADDAEERAEEPERNVVKEEATAVPVPAPEVVPLPEIDPPSDNLPDADDSVPAKPVAVEKNDDESEESDSISVALILPFMLESENMTKSAENFTNYYRGFLLAVDSLSAKSDLPVKIMAFDSEGSAEKVAAMMKSPEVYNCNYIVAPDDAASIDAITAVTDTTDAVVLNLFAVKNDSHRTHESLMQGNISHDLMYAAAINGFCKANKSKKVILLNATDIPAEKSGFTSELTSKLVASGIPYEKLDYAGKLTAQDLAQLPPAKDYVFVPTSHSREALMRILPALEDYRELNVSASLFGYPEWIVLQGDIKERLHRLNTTIYSRFASDEESGAFKRVAASYENIYGVPLEKAIPITALLGFDSAAWILNAATNGTESPYTGVQNSFKFIEIEGGGSENSALYFINFTPMGTTDVVLL